MVRLMGMRFLLVALLALAGCSADVGEPAEASPAVSECAVPFSLAPGFTHEQRDGVASAFAMWNGVTVATKRLCLSDGAARPIRLIPDRGGEWQSLLAETGGVAFIGLTRSTEIVVVEGLDPVEFRHVLQHEAGHVLGLQHITARGVMTPAEMYAADALTDDDIAECRRVGACE